MSSSPEPEIANGYSHSVVHDVGDDNGDAHSESDLSEVNDTVTARPLPSTSDDHHQSADEDENMYGEEQGANASSESDNDNPSEDADFDMEESPAASHSDAAQDERSTSNDSRQSTKRKVANEEEDYINANPELYGLRRSVC
jgi:chromodomain-helicase-DNA-binding protein 1